MSKFRRKHSIASAVSTEASIEDRETDRRACRSADPARPSYQRQTFGRARATTPRFFSLEFSQGRISVSFASTCYTE